MPSWCDFEEVGALQADVSEKFEHALEPGEGVGTISWLAIMSSVWPKGPAHASRTVVVLIQKKAERPF